jgi:preprotein translocase subunit SecD
MKKNLKKQDCPDHCRFADLPVRHLRNSIRDQRQGLAGAISKRIHLGLDLQGGVHLILQVQVSEAVSDETDSAVAGDQQDTLKTAT